MISTAIALSLVFAAPSPHHRFGLTEAMPRIDGTIRVASYNMLNFFDQVDDPTLQGDYDDFGDNPGPTSLERCRELEKVIRDLDADILALQEVESEEALSWFNETFLVDMGYEYVVSEEVGYYRGIEQSLLSRFPVKEIRTWPNADLTSIERSGGGWTDIPAGTDKISFQRSPLCVTVVAPSGYELTLFVLHHKAGRNAWHRELEALQIMQYIGEMSVDDPNRNIAVIGDFNAQPWERSIQAYTRNGLTDSISHRVANLKWDDVSPLRKTHVSNRQIDFILLNPAALKEYVIDSGFVLGSSAQQYNYREDPPPAGYASDHCAIAIDMVPREAQGSTATALPWPNSATKTALAVQKAADDKKAARLAKEAADALAAEEAQQAAELEATKTEMPSDPAKTTSPEGAPFVASKNSKVFHTGTCGRKRVSEKNQVEYSSFSEATGSGKRAAKCCNPTAE